MRERMKTVGGTMTLQSAVKKGTHVSFEMPV